jgi:hypothetical protein
MIISSNILFAQDLPAKNFAVLVEKSIFFNKEKSNKYIIIYSNNKKEKATEINSFLKGKIYESTIVKGTTDYTNVLFIGLSNLQINDIKKNFNRILSFSDNKDNIDVVSVSFYIQGSGRPKILVNLKNAKKEADFKSQFLKIAEIIE